MPDLIQRHDWALWINILKLNSSYYAYCIGKPLVVRLRHRASLSSNIRRSIYLNYKVLKIYGELSKINALCTVLINILRVLIRRIKAYLT